MTDWDHDFSFLVVYVCGERSGIIAEDSFHIDESLNRTSKLDITTEKKLVEETLNQLRAKNATEETITSTMKDLGIRRARLYGWPNTYVFTKAMGEMLLGSNKEDIPLVIIRPAMITSTYKEPFPGWIEGFRTVDSVIIGYGKGKVKGLPVNPDTIIDMLVYMAQPEGFVDRSKPSHICQLHRSLYGLKKAPQSWFHKLRSALLSWGFTNLVSNTSIFFKFSGLNKLFVLVYVDDILITVFVEKTLRIQPNVKKLYLLVRAKDEYSATQRILNEVVEIELFKVLRDKWGGNLHSFISEKVAAVAGDISCDNLGVNDSNIREEMFREIDVVLNFAATTNFDERYDVALGTNTMAAFHVLSFAKRCAKIKMFMHVSTAYVCGETSGVITEKSFYLGETLGESKTSKLDINSEKKLVEETLNQLQAKNATKEAVNSTMKELGLKRARLYGWPNTYVFTKAMGEMLLGSNKENLPLVIIRPTIISSIYKEPLPGWIEGLRTIDSIICAYGKGKLQCLPASPDTVLDLDIYTNSDRKIKLVMRLAELYKPYMFFQGIFDNTNMEKLGSTMKKSEAHDEVDVFNFDPECIDWEDYIINTHIPGLIRYVIK
ncbi:hypothetical protein LWI28_015841 [Acer negundo]|uniref:Fatty acyl-CoA reductase n=1 Tax=Acer negundo TaxID=4023 RepID=A0AAD5P0M3_ACENE|nr:hypothetical protein LWI28_015841 [Acer negundo]